MFNSLIVDYSLYIIIDQNWIGNRNLKKLTEDVIHGGATILQYRNKLGNGQQFYINSEMIHDIAYSYHVPLVINDRVDIALATGAEGVHVGQDDIPANVVRKLIGPERLIGLSISHLKELDCVQEVNYLGVGAIFSTCTKLNAEYSGLNIIRQIRSKSILPLVGIGGINPKNFELVMQAGADGVAVISSVLGTDNPELAARQMFNHIQQIKQNR